MSRIRKTNTEPELALRRAVRKLGLVGYRFYRKLPGAPDMSFGRGKLAIFVDGCFWHRCPACRIPVPRTPYWTAKIGKNVERDKRVTRELAADGWFVTRFWEHEVLEDPGRCAKNVARILRKRRRS
jgi:DNA mismatch endonuclease (patch repair protein)